MENLQNKTEYRYNVLFFDKEGLRILTSEAYQRLIQQTPSLMHENLGDFYSEVPCDSLSDKIYNLLDNQDFMGSKMSEDLIIIESSSFDQDYCDIEKDYLIKEREGIRLYYPGLHLKHNTKTIQLIYSICITALEGLFSNEKEGTLQKCIKKIRKELRESTMGKFN